MRLIDFPHVYSTLPARYNELRGQVALITGGGRGIGFGIAARLAREGMKLFIAGWDEGELNDAADALKSVGADVVSMAGDLAVDAVTESLVERTVNHFGSLHLLVNNAADLRRVRIPDLTVELIDQQWAVNVRAPLLLSMRAAAVMQSNTNASIVNISSVGGILSHLPGLPYGMTKSALDGLTRNLAMDLGERGIRANAVAPGWTPSTVDPEAAADYLRETSPMVSLRKPGRSQDIAAAVAFLASDDASYITGHVLYVDGGISIQLHPPEQPI